MHIQGRWSSARACKRTPKGFNLLKIWVKARKIRVKHRPTLFDFKKWRSKVCIKTHEHRFLEVTPKGGLHYLCARKFLGKTFRSSLGKFGRNPSHPKVLPTYSTPVMKGTSAPVAPLLNGGWEMPPPYLHSPLCLCIFFYTHSLYLLL